MKTDTLPTAIDARVAYEIWSSEPEVVRFVDLRENRAFQNRRVPGSVWLSDRDRLPALAVTAPGMLFIVVSDNDWKNEIASYGLENVVCLAGGLDAWFGHGFPVCPQDRDQIRKCLEKESKMAKDMIFHQLFERETSTYTYLLADADTREAVLIDPVLETVDRDLQLIQELGLRLLYVLDTHVHADHVTGAGEIRRRTGAKTGVSRHAKVECADVALEDGQEIRFGKHVLRVLETPGHTDSCLSFYCDGKVFTGDALLIRGTGRTDFQQGSPDRLYASIHDKLFKLPPETTVYPGHDYRGQTRSSIEMEKKLNPRVGGGKTKDDFISIMKELKLDQPKRIHEAVPANMGCGLAKDGRVFHPQTVNGVPEITPRDLHAHLGKTLILDVRRPDEFNNELGHVPGSRLVTMGDELTRHLEKLDRNLEIVFVCRSGGRSGQTTQQALQMGFKKAANMVGGMLKWNELGLPVERDGNEERIG